MVTGYQWVCADRMGVLVGEGWMYVPSCTSEICFIVFVFTVMKGLFPDVVWPVHLGG